MVSMTPRGKPRPKNDGMVAARHAFTTTYDGKPDCVTAGELFDPHHEIVLANPAAFGLTATRPHTSSRRARSVPTKPPSGPAWRLGPAPRRHELLGRQVEVLRGESTVPVHLSGNAWRMITGEAFAMRRANVETGGLLFGYGATSYAPKLQVTSASTPGPRAEAAKEWFRHDGAHDLELSRAIAAQSEGHLTEVGHWHTHPRGVGEPSPADIGHWVGMRDVLNKQRVTSRYAAVIVTPDPVAGWVRPRGHAWIVQTNQRTGSPTLQRAALSHGTA